MLQFLLPLLAAGAGAGIGAATASGKKGSKGRGALKGALLGGALGLGGVGLTGLGMGGSAAGAAAAAGANPLTLAGASSATPLAAAGAGAAPAATPGFGSMLMNTGKQQLASGLMSSVMGGNQSQITPVAEMGGMSAAPAMASAANIQMSNPLSFSNVDPQYLASLKQKMQGQYSGGY